MKHRIMIYWTDIGGSRGHASLVSPSGPKFLHFHAVFGKNWSNDRLAPP